MTFARKTECCEISVDFDGRDGSLGANGDLRAKKNASNEARRRTRRRDFNDYRGYNGCRLKSLEEREIFCDSFFNFRRKPVIMNLDFPRFDVGVIPAALWRVRRGALGNQEAS